MPKIELAVLLLKDGAIGKCQLQIKVCKHQCRHSLRSHSVSYLSRLIRAWLVLLYDFTTVSTHSSAKSCVFETSWDQINCPAGHSVTWFSYFVARAIRRHLCWSELSSVP